MPEHLGHQRQAILATAAIVAVTAGTAAVGSLSGDFRSEWYERLRKPSWQPSGEVIGFVWTLLYTCIGVAAVLLWRRPAGRRKPALWRLMALQYGLNALYTPVFTRLHALRLATIDCAALTVCVTAIVVLAWPIQRMAALLLAPYALWAAFATALSWRLQRLNPAQ